MNKQLKACIILLENLLFGVKKYSRKDFIVKLEQEELSSSNSSVTRVLNKIYLDFGIKIQQKKDFYEINENETEVDYLEKYKNIKNLIFRELIHKNAKGNTLTSQFISFGNDVTNKGIEFVDYVLNSILESKKLKIGYQAFYESEIKQYIVNPIFIKEYQNRWYLIAEKEGSHEYKTFAFDRIQSLEILKVPSNFKHKNKDLFKNTIGINHSNNFEEITLWFNDWQGKYIKTLPLHSSQKIISDDKTGLIISIYVNVNFELEQIIKSYGSAVKVIQPEFLKAGIMAELEKTLNQYKK